MPTEWFCQIDDDEYGPVTSTALRALAASGRLSETDRVRNGRVGNWVTASHVAGLFDASKSVPKAPPPVPVAIARRRSEGVALAADRFGAEIVICDDAFSHLALARAVDLVLVHGRDGLGNGRCTPAGPLREPPRALRRATAILLNVAAGEDPETMNDLHRARVECPVFRFRYAAPTLRRIADGAAIDPAQLADRRLLAFAGTARPADFFGSLAAAGWSVAATRIFPDHYAFANADLTALAQLAAAQGICYVAATEKDAVKFPARLPPGVEWLVAGLELAWDGDDGARLVDLADRPTN